MKKRLASLLSLITMGAMLFGSVPITTLAVNETDPAVTESVTIVQEDVSLRGAYEKHFLMSDGSYSVTVYNEPVHQNVNGVWVEVDNTLRLTTDAKGVAQYQTVNGITDVSFAKTFQNELVTMRQDEYSFSWDVTAIPGTSGHISATATATRAEAEIIPLSLSGMDAEEVKTVATKSTSTVRYNDALAQGVDVEYIVTPSRVKENIILDSPKDITGYLVTLYTENLSARLLENNEIEFYNTNGKVIFTMWAPYMYDSAGALSEDITLQLLPKGTGCYMLSMVPNAQWLSDPNRVYPVVIDPGATPSNAQRNIIDNFVKEGQGVQNNNLDRLYIGKKDGCVVRSYIRYQQMPYIPVGSTINSATMHLTITRGTNTANKASAYMVTGSNWESGTITWANKPAASTLLAVNISHNNMSYYSFSCLSAINSWYLGSPVGQNANYGVMIRYTDETISDYNAFYSADHSEASERPALTINYQLPVIPSTAIVWPAPNKYLITSEFGYRTYSNRMHRGIDISCDEGTELVAAIAGRVSYTYGDNIGNALIITQTNSAFQVHYYHLQDDGYIAPAGSIVYAGAPVAYSGNTGNSDGAHLHFQVQYAGHNDMLFNPIEIYHEDDRRWNLTNPNPMFVYLDDRFQGNPNFNFVYSASIYNAVYNSP